jgi:hypothetical protein
MLTQIRALRFIQASCPAVLGIAIGMVCNAPASGQDCEMDFSQPGEPLPGISSFSAQVTVTTSDSCATHTGCGGTFVIQASGTHGTYRLSCCNCFAFLPLRWFAVAGGGTVIFAGNYYPPVFPFSAETSGSAAMTFTHAARVGTAAGSFTVTGGRVSGPGGQWRYFHAGETAALASLDTKSSSERSFDYQLCLDLEPANGICDQYDDAARAFGDFDSSGSIDAADLALLLGNWGSSGVGDIDQDGVVNAGDLSFLLSRWGQGA